MSDADKQAEATRAEIRRHAEELFAHYGFGKTNVGDIAKRCGMSPGNLYRYYRNKQAIGLAVVEHFFKMSEAEMETQLMLPGGTPEDRIRRLIETGVSLLVRELEKNTNIVELTDFLCSNEEGSALLQRHIAWKCDQVTREIEAGMDQGLFRRADPRETAVVALTATKVFWMPPALALWKDRDTILPELRQVLDLIFRGLKA